MKSKRIMYFIGLMVRLERYRLSCDDPDFIGEVQNIMKALIGMYMELEMDGSDEDGNAILIKKKPIGFTVD